MNDVDAEFQKRRINRYLKKWRPAGFGWWKITIEWSRAEDGDSNATINEDWEYRQAVITFYLVRAALLSDDDLEAVVVHELSHLLVGSIADYSTDDKRKQTEFAVSCVERALLWTHEFVLKKT